MPLFSDFDTDFMALEVRRGHPTLLVDYGTGTARVEHNHNTILDDNFHKIEIKLTTEVSTVCMFFILEQKGK